MRLNAEKARAAMRRWRHRHPEEHRAELQRYYAKDPQRRQKQIDASEHRPAVRRAMWQRRRAREARAEGSFSVAEWLALVGSYGARCAYCGSAAPLEMDHRVPLARGGTNAIDNILPACGRCNRRKHTRTEAEFRAWLALQHRD